MRPKRAAVARWLGRVTAPLLLTVAGTAALIGGLSLPVLRPVLGAAVLLGMPTYVLAVWTFRAMEERLSARLFAFGLALAGVIVGALLLNTVLPWWGDDRPLEERTLLLASGAVNALLVLVASTRVSLVRPTRWPANVRAFARAVLTARLAPEVTLAALALVLAIGGAVRLNNGRSGAVAVTAHLLAVAALATCVLVGDTPRRTVATIYLSGLALLLGTSLRGWYIVGHDIQNEYLSYTLTFRARHWSMDQYASAYHACLSVNILPTVLGQVMGVSGLVVFKVVVQVIFALVPVIVYVAARRIVTPLAAILGAAFFIIFPTFLTDMPYLTRQEAAFLFVALALLAVGANQYPTWVRQCLTLVFGVGVVLSHYSTTYMLIATLMLSLVGSRVLPAVAAWWRRRHEHTHASRPAGSTGMVFTVLAPGVVAVLTAAAWTWSTPITHSGAHLAETVTELTTSLIQGKSVVGSSDLRFVGGGGPSPEERFSTYYDGLVAARAATPGEYVVPRVTDHDAARPQLTTVPPTPLTAAGRALDRVGIPAGHANLILRASAGLALELLLAIGLIALWIKVRAAGRVWDEQVWLVLGSIGAVGVIVAVPGLSADYGVLRAFQQALLLAAPLVGVGLMTLFIRARHAYGATAVVLFALGACLTGAVAATFGGTPGVISQADEGPYFDLLYVDAPEMAATRWLGTELERSDLPFVAASDIVSITRLQTQLPRGSVVTNDFLPVALRSGEYVFLTRQSSRESRGTVFFSGDLLTYRYPRDVLDRRLDLVYSSGDAEIFR